MSELNPEYVRVVKLVLAARDINLDALMDEIAYQEVEGKTSDPTGLIQDENIYLAYFKIISAARDFVISTYSVIILDR